MIIKNTGNRIFFILRKIAFAFAIANLVGLYLRWFLHHDHVFGFIKLFDLNTELNLPSFYSGLVILLCSLLLGIIAFSHSGIKRLQWSGLSALFLYLCLDEVIQIHDRIDIPIRNALHTGGIFRHAWIIPYSLIIVCLLFVYFGFLKKLDSKTRKSFFMAGFIFVTGAIGFEVISGLIDVAIGHENFIYGLCYTIEEFLEMLGMSLFVRGLVNYLEHSVGSITFDFRKTESLQVVP